jgi:hypothetical protein
MQRHADVMKTIPVVSNGRKDESRSEDANYDTPTCNIVIGAIVQAGPLLFWILDLQHLVRPEQFTSTYVALLHAYHHNPWWCGGGEERLAWDY